MSDSSKNNVNSQNLEKTAEEIIADLHLETAKIPWVELQRFFAGGKLLLLDQGQDLVQVAASLVKNDVSKLQALIDDGLIEYPSNEKALEWVDQDAHLWALVLKPWVLVQENIQ
ncbi:MAG: DUF2288 family protein [Arenicella sp.]